MPYSAVQTLSIKLYLKIHMVHGKYSSVMQSLPSPAFPNSKPRLLSFGNNPSNGTKWWAVAFGATNHCK